MQMLGPYRVVRTLGTCQVGTVWAGVDAAGGQVTVAVLDATVASDPRWREAFTATANSLAHGGGMRALHADFTTAAPWVAVAAGPGPGAAQIFIALGQDYRPEPAPQPEPPPAPAAPVVPPTGVAQVGPSAGMAQVPVQPVPAARPVTAPEQRWAPQAPAAPGPAPAAGAPAPDPGPAAAFQTPQAPAPPVRPAVHRPVSPALVSPGQVSPGLVSPSPISGGMPPGGPISGGPISGGPISGGPMPVGGVWPETTEPTRRRASVWVGIIALIVLLPGVGSAIISTTMRPGAQPPPPVRRSSAPAVSKSPTPPPIRPGLEPPTAGEWPATWAKFTTADRTTTQALEGLGFTFRTPDTWVCARAPREADVVRYRCGVPTGGRLVVGGDLLVRNCAAPCNEVQRAELRKVEDAFGLQWIRSGGFTHYADGDAEVDGTRSHALVVIAFWDSPPTNQLDRQVVFRMIAPSSRTDEIRKVANDIRDALA